MTPFRILIVLLLTQTCWAEEQQNLAQLRQFAKQYISQQITPIPGAEINIKVGQLDNRLKLKPCGKGELSAYLPYTGVTAATTSTVGIRCAGPRAWSLFIPIKTQMLAPVITANKPLPRGHLIHSDDLSAREVDLKQLTQGYFRKSPELVGKLVSQPLRAQMVITPQHLTNRQLVKRGAKVQILAKSNGIQISAPGIALSHGKLGETIKIKNINSEKILAAKILNENQVQVALSFDTSMR